MTELIDLTLPLTTHIATDVDAPYHCHDDGFHDDIASTRAMVSVL